ITELSCGLSEASVSPLSAGTKRPLMNSCVCMVVLPDEQMKAEDETLPATPARPASSGSYRSKRGLERYRIRREFTALVTLGQIGGCVLPHEQHRTLLRITLVANIGRHGRNVAGVHRDTGAGFASVLVADVPDDLVGQLQE